MLLEVRIDRLIPHMHSIIQVVILNQFSCARMCKNIEDALLMEFSVLYLQTFFNLWSHFLFHIFFSCSTCCRELRIPMRMWPWRPVSFG